MPTAGVALATSAPRVALSKAGDLRRRGSARGTAAAAAESPSSDRALIVWRRGGCDDEKGAARGVQEVVASLAWEDFRIRWRCAASRFESTLVSCPGDFTCSSAPRRRPAEARHWAPRSPHLALSDSSLPAASSRDAAAASPQFCSVHDGLGVTEEKEALGCGPVVGLSAPDGRRDEARLLAAASAAVATAVVAGGRGRGCAGGCASGCSGVCAGGCAGG